MYDYTGKIVLEGENIAIEVHVKARDPFQPRRAIERLHRRVKLWFPTPQ